MQDEIGGDLNLSGIFSGGGGGGSDTLTYEPGMLFGGGAPPVIETGGSLLPGAPTQAEPGGLSGFLKSAGEFLRGGREGDKGFNLGDLTGLAKAGLGIAQIPLSVSALNQAASARRSLDRSAT